MIIHKNGSWARQREPVQPILFPDWQISRGPLILKPPNGGQYKGGHLKLVLSGRRRQRLSHQPNVSVRTRPSWTSQASRARARQAQGPLSNRAPTTPFCDQLRKSKSFCVLLRPTTEKHSLKCCTFVTDNASGPSTPQVRVKEIIPFGERDVIYDWWR